MNDTLKNVEYKLKTYREISVDGVEYKGRDSYKRRSPTYIFEIFQDNYFTNKKVLDLGCSAGSILFEARKRGIDQGVGVEISNSIEAALDIKAKHNIENINFYHSDIIGYFIKHLDEFDCIFILNVLHHLPDPYIVMDYMLNLSNQYICLELPDKRWYQPYKRDKKKKKNFKKPLNPDDVIQYFKISGFDLKKVLESKNQENFKGGKRRVYLFQKQPIQEASFGEIDISKRQLILGPGASGKTTLLKKLGLQNEGPGPHMYVKYRDQYSVRFSTAKFIAKKLLNALTNKSYKLEYYDESVFAENIKVLQMNPTYRIKRVNRSIRGERLNIDAWVNIAKKNDASVIICYVPKKIAKQRLIARMKEKHLTPFLNNQEIESVINILLDYNINDKDIDRCIKDYLKEIHKANKFNEIKKSVVYQFCANYFLSYQRLFSELSLKNIAFKVLHTYHK